MQNEYRKEWVFVIGYGIVDIDGYIDMVGEECGVEWWER